MAAVSIFDIFKIGIGPSSSHTVGPMKSANAFVADLATRGESVATVKVTVHGSLAWTGKGHGTDSAIILGLVGLQPETIDPDEVDGQLNRVRQSRRLVIPEIGEIEFDPETHIVFDYAEELPRHTNGMCFRAYAPSGEMVAEEQYYSLGGGFIARNDEPEAQSQSGTPPFVFDSGDSLLAVAAENDLSIAELVYRNEQHWRTSDDIDRRLESIWEAMSACIDRGLVTEGVLPGSMQVKRRAPKLFRRLSDRGDRSAQSRYGW